ncbi:MAG TPA: 3-hydroxyacyl-CoA dehydrogenase NAD-binding domain-containing protein [Candidatus Hydrogenedentes bacterium]|nr:3-hydroxyacyl-CoA dehydrogenase NAD-binding domain-containing protein [Candidatus Hydrogenedentota bacterium]
MNRHILIAGSGKMARDIGFYFVRRGHRVTWASQSHERLVALGDWFRKAVRRATRVDPDFGPADARFCVASGVGAEPVDVLLECTVEDIATKQAFLHAIRGVVSDNTLLVSNSSSILPQEIHPDCLGFHCYYPLEMTRFAEIIVPSNAPASLRSRILDFAAESGLECIEEDNDSAFIVNRLLLPVHAECFRLLLSGIHPVLIDAATISPLSSVGQLSLMDAIGLDLIHASAVRYLDRMPHDEIWPYAPLIEGLERALPLGKRGIKTGNGLLCGALFTEIITPPPNDDSPALAKRFLYLLVNTCYDALDRNAITERGLSLSLGALLASEQRLSQVVEAEGRDRICETLDRLYRETRLPYFQPARRFGNMT